MKGGKGRGGKVVWGKEGSTHRWRGESRRSDAAAGRGPSDARRSLLSLPPGQGQRRPSWPGFPLPPSRLLDCPPRPSWVSIYSSPIPHFHPFLAATPASASSPVLVGVVKVLLAGKEEGRKGGGVGRWRLGSMATNTDGSRGRTKGSEWGAHTKHLYWICGMAAAAGSGWRGG